MPAANRAAERRHHPDVVPVSGRTDWLTVAESAVYLSVTVRTLRSWIAEGKLPAYRTGRMIRVKRADLDALLLPMRDGAE